MDYHTQPLPFKIRKVVRYIGLYGLPRTIVKIRGQYHMRKAFSPLPKVPKPRRAGGFVGIIGCGNYAFCNIAYYLSKVRGRILRAAMDVNLNRAASLFRTYGLSYYTDQAQEIYEDPEIKLVYIASNHASHADYAIQCILHGKNVHIEKPHVVSLDQLARLEAAMKTRPDSKVFLGFNRPRARLFRALEDALRTQAGPAMLNWFVAGHDIPADHWYFSEAEGGRILGNLCHWTDLTLRLVGIDKALPCHIIPATPPGARSDFVASMIFSDDSCASITFSAKGHTFEGVREVLNAHKGSALASLADFQYLRLDFGHDRRIIRSRYRDHGHQANILHSLTSASGEDSTYVVATARFFLAVRNAVESGKEVILV